MMIPPRGPTLHSDNGIGIFKSITRMHHERQVQVLRQLNLTTKDLFLTSFVLSSSGNPDHFSWATTLGCFNVQVNRPPLQDYSRPPQWGAKPAWDRVLMLICQGYVAQSSVCQNQRYCGLQPIPWPSPALLLFFSCEFFHIEWGGYQKSAWSSFLPSFFFH